MSALAVRRAAVAGWLAAALVGASWLGMMTVHEFGHVLHAWFGGGRVERVVLRPLAFSRTDLADNPRPALVAWGGVVWGTALPLAAWAAARAIGRRAEFVARFFAGFCAVANGAYLASAAVVPAGDTEDLLRLGTPAWVIAPAGVVPLSAGLALWAGTRTHLRSARVGTLVLEASAASGTMAALVAWMTLRA